MAGSLRSLYCDRLQVNSDVRQQASAGAQARPDVRPTARIADRTVACTRSTLIAMKDRGLQFKHPAKPGLGWRRRDGLVRSATARDSFPCSSIRTFQRHTALA